MQSSVFGASVREARGSGRDGKECKTVDFDCGGKFLDG